MLQVTDAGGGVRRPCPASSMSEGLQTILEQRREFLAFVRRRVPDPALAEDILQSAYVRALEAETPASEESAVAWFYRVLRNAVIDHYRHRASAAGKMEQPADDDFVEPAARAAHDPEILQVACRCVESVLPSLRPGYAELLREVDLAERPLTEFAARHGITAGNAAVRAHRARAALKDAMIRVCGTCSAHGCMDCSCVRTYQAQHPNKA